MPSKKSTIQFARKYEIFPTDEQRSLINRSIGCARFVWNWALAEKKTAFEAGEELTWADLSKRLTALKATEEHQWLNEVNSQALVAELQHLKRAYDKFFSNVKKGINPPGFPRFKNKDSKASFSNQNANKGTLNRVRPDPKKKGFALLTLMKLRDISVRLHRPLDGNIGTVTISRSPSGRYYASLVIDSGKEFPATKSADEATTVGILRTETHLQLSDGTKVKHPGPFERTLKRLQIIDRRLCRKRTKNPEGWKTSKRYAYLKQRRAVLHEKIAAIRADIQHKITANITVRYDGIGVDNSAVSGTLASVRSPRARRLADAALYEYTRQLTYKAKQQGKRFATVAGETAEEVKQNALTEFRKE